MPHAIPVRRLSDGRRHYFFGYYGINPYDASGCHHAALAVDFCDHRPRCEDEAQVGLIDAASGAFEALGRTRAFNFQQGAMLNWLNTQRYGEELLYNDISDGELIAVAVGVAAGRRRVIQGGVSGVSPNRQQAASINYLRNFQCRPVVGYDAGQTGRPRLRAPADDGLYAVDLRTGSRRILVTLAQLADSLPAPEAQRGWLWVDHTVFNPSGTRLMFFVRVCREDGRGWYSSLWTIGSDGRDLRCLLDYSHWISHFDWYDDMNLLVSSDIGGARGFYMLADAPSAGRAPFHHELMPVDGHACFSPCRRWLACDTYPFESGGRSIAQLRLIDLRQGRSSTIGSFDSPALYRGDLRCDLHPRWNTAGTLVSFDSVHEGARQIYEADLAEIAK